MGEQHKKRLEAVNNSYATYLLDYLLQNPEGTSVEFSADRTQVTFSSVIVLKQKADNADVFIGSKKVVLPALAQHKANKLFRLTQNRIR